MAGVGVHHQHRVRQMLGQTVRVATGIIVSKTPFTTRHGWVIRRSFAKRSPSTRSQARNAAICACATFGPESGLAIFRTSCEPRHECLAGRLAPSLGGEEQLHQHLVASELRVPEDAG